MYLVLMYNVIPTPSRYCMVHVSVGITLYINTR
jgi:hypothetical protein